MRVPTDIRSGLARLDAELQSLAQNRDHLNRQRSRFLLEKVPRVSSHHCSDDDTESEIDRDDDSVCREQLQIKLQRDHDASRPYYQFDEQTNQERDRIIEGVDTRTAFVPLRTSYASIAHDRVKKDWMEQGIWDNNWKSLPGWCWMHEESYEPPTPKENEETAPRRSIFSAPAEHAISKLASQETGLDETEKHCAPLKDDQKRNNDASRPFYQFIHQMSKEREWMQGPTAKKSDPASPSADINTRAYENVKASWVKRGIWKEEWGIMPGMAWKHELPMEQPAESVPERKESQNGSTSTDLETDVELHDGYHSFSHVCHLVPVTDQGSDNWAVEGIIPRRGLFEPYASHPVVQEEGPASVVGPKITETSEEPTPSKGKSSKRKVANDESPSEPMIPISLFPCSFLRARVSGSEDGKPDREEMSSTSRVPKAQLKKGGTCRGKAPAKRKAREVEEPLQTKFSKRKKSHNHTAKDLGSGVEEPHSAMSVPHQEMQHKSEPRRSARLRNRSLCH